MVKLPGHMLQQIINGSSEMHVKAFQAHISVNILQNLWLFIKNECTLQDEDLISPGVFVPKIIGSDNTEKDDVSTSCLK